MLAAAPVRLSATMAIRYLLCAIFAIGPHADRDDHHSPQDRKAMTRRDNHEAVLYFTITRQDFDDTLQATGIRGIFSHDVQPIPIEDFLPAIRAH